MQYATSDDLVCQKLALLALSSLSPSPFAPTGPEQELFAGIRDSHPDQAVSPPPKKKPEQAHFAGDTDLLRRFAVLQRR